MTHKYDITEVDDNLNRDMKIRIFRERTSLNQFCSINKVSPFAIIVLWEESDRERIVDGKEPICLYWSEELYSKIIKVREKRDRERIKKKIDALNEELKKYD